MAKASVFEIIIGIIILWGSIAFLSAIGVHEIAISRITTLMAMFTSGAGFLLYILISSFLDFQRTRLQKTADAFVAFSILLFSPGYFIFSFLLPVSEYSKNIMHETSRIDLNCATILCLLIICMLRFWIVLIKLNYNKKV